MLAHWLAFTLASVVLLAIPGPTALLVISYALGHGRRFALATTAGVVLGDVTAMTASLVGLGAVLATSALLFSVLKWIGALYLLWLGVRLWRAPVGPIVEQDAPLARPSRVMLHAFAVTALNPKSMVFFIAFLPQFFDLARPLLPQMALFEATFVLLAAANAIGYALTAARVRQTIRRASVQRAVNRVGGSLLIGAGVLAVAARR